MSDLDNKTQTADSHFEETGAAYAKYRPGYAEAIFDDLSREVPDHTLAVDCGCGTGQITQSLSLKFRKVYGVDVSKDQLAHAYSAPNVEYVNQGAENLSFLADNSVDLITVGTAYHWFDSDKFWREVRRVLKPRGLIAVMQVQTPKVKEAPGLFEKFLREELEPYLPKVRSSNEKLSEQIPHGFERINLPNEYSHELRRRVADVVGWPKTTSAYKSYREQTGLDPSDKLLEQFKEKGFDSEAEVTFDNPASILVFQKRPLPNITGESD